MAETEIPKLDPKGLMITRKRKKWKFAHFDSYVNCFSFHRGGDSKKIRDEINTYFPSSKLGNKRKLVLEIAAGNAQFSLELARRHPECNFVAIDIKSDRLYTSAKQALADGVENIAFLRTHMNELDQVFENNSADEIWLTFPDPFPRDRSAKHRLSHSSFLRRYRDTLTDTGKLKFKTDNRELFLWSLEQFVAEKWQFQELSFDLHESDLPDEYKIKTQYEERYLHEGKPINYCSIRT